MITMPVQTVAICGQSCSLNDRLHWLIRDEWPEIGDIVRLTSEAISKNKNNILQKNCLKVKKGEDTGVVVDIDETSRRYL